MATTSFALGALALIPIYAGAHSSLTVPRTVKRELKEAAKQAGVEDAFSSDDEAPEEDKLLASDVALFPIIASVALGGLFLTMKYFDKATVNKVLAFYFMAMGFAGLGKAGTMASKAIVGKEYYRRLDRFKLLMTKNRSEITSLRWTWFHVASYVAAGSFVVYQHFQPHWVSGNVIALALALNAIAQLKLDSFLTGSIMLGGLFFYDILWVFGTTVMVTVAKGIEGPIKITWPKDITDAKSPFSLLGLGDIVIPGVFIALALRFDFHRAIEAHVVSSKKALSASSSRGSSESSTFAAAVVPPQPEVDGPFPRPYFWSTIVAYVVGLGTTMVVMHIFKAAQPALLYLSPACVASVVLCAWWRGEIKKAWAWEDAEETVEGAEEKKSEVSDGDKSGAKDEPKGTSSGLKASAQAIRRETAGSGFVTDDELSSAIEGDVDTPGAGAKPKKRRSKKAAS